MNKNTKKFTYTAVLAALLVTPGVNAAVNTTGNNFTMNVPNGGLTGGTNDIRFIWDETFNTDPATAVENGAISTDTPTPFFNGFWSAHDVMIYGPGTYSFHTNCPAGLPGCNGSAVEYTPNSGFSGVDSFTYTVVDSAGGAAVGTVNVTVVAVNDPPSTLSDVLATDQDMAGTINPLSNDTDEEGDPMTVTGATDGANGTVTFSANSVTYTPELNFSGLDSFTYDASDGVDTSTGTINVAVNLAGNNAPTATSDAFSVKEDALKNHLVLGNDSDSDGDALTLIGVTQPANGTVSFEFTSTSQWRTKYTGGTEYSGPDSYSYTVADARGGVATGTVNVTVTDFNDKPRSKIDLLSTNQDAGPVTINPLTNDTDNDGDALIVADANTSYPAANGTVSFTADSVTYTPNSGFWGIDYFSYKLSDGVKTNFGEIVVAINQTGNTLPVTVTDNVIVQEDTTTKILVLDGIGNDSDAEDNLLGGSFLGTILDFWPPNPLIATLPSNGQADSSNADRLNVTVNSGQIGAHMLFDWPEPGTDIDLFNIWVQGAWDSVDNSGAVYNICPVPPDPNCNFTADTWSNDVTTIWDGTSIDGPDIGVVPGIIFIDGPFGGLAQGSFNVMGVWANAIPTAADAPCAVIEGSGDQSCSGLTLPGDDTDIVDHPASGQTVSYALTSTGTLGTATLTNAATGDFSYDPGATVGGPAVFDTFTYTATDGIETSTAGTITVNIRTTNTAPTAPVQLSPSDTAMDVSATPTLSWQASTDADGDPIQYNTTVCEDLALTVNCVIDNDVLAGLSINNNMIMIAGIGSASLLLMGLTGTRRRQQWVQLGLLSVMALTLSACGSDSKKPTTGPGNPSHTLTTTLTAGTTYYWKVTADDGLPGGTTDSLVWSFTTAP